MSIYEFFCLFKVLTTHKIQANLLKVFHPLIQPLCSVFILLASYLLIA